MKLSESGKHPKYALDEVYHSLGDVSHVKSIGQIPHGPQDMYTMEDGQFQVKRLVVLKAQW